MVPLISKVFSSFCALDPGEMISDVAAGRLVSPAASPAALKLFQHFEKSIKMPTGPQSKTVVYEPIAILAGGCVVFVLCWFFY